jgi:hypothetical protein
MASGIAAGSSRSRTSLFSTEFLVPKWAKLFFLVVGLQALICVAFESYVEAQQQRCRHDALSSLLT